MKAVTALMHIQLKTWRIAELFLSMAPTPGPALCVPNRRITSYQYNLATDTLRFSTKTRSCNILVEGTTNSFPASLSSVSQNIFITHLIFQTKKCIGQ